MSTARTAGPVLTNLLASPNIASKRWVFEQYDTMVRTNTVTGPGGSDAAIVRIKGTRKGLAVKVDGNGRYVYLDPRQGGRIAVAEAARNVVCSGGRPVAITNCLNFGNPYKPEVYWTFREAVAGIGEACRAFGTPVTGGNVSFYNENVEGAVFPTPTIGMVGIVDDVETHPVTVPFKEEGDLIFLLTPEGWTHRESLDASEYLAVVHGLTRGGAPPMDLEEEAAVQAGMLHLIRAGHVRSAHDVSDGGLAVALAECVIHADGLGAHVELESGGIRLDALLFGEAQSRIVFSTPADRAGATQETIDASARAGRLVGASPSSTLSGEATGTSVRATCIGVVRAGALTIEVDGEPVVEASAEALREPYDRSIPDRMER